MSEPVDQDALSWLPLSNDWLITSPQMTNQPPAKLKPVHFTKSPWTNLQKTPSWTSIHFAVLQGSLYCKETCFRSFCNLGAVRKIGMDSAQIVVSGFPEGTTKDQLMIYFQSERESGGGDVDSIEIDRGRAFVTFEDLEGTWWNLFCKVALSYSYMCCILNFVIQQRGLTIQENRSAFRNTLNHFRSERDFRFGFSGSCKVMVNILVGV